MLFKKNQTQTKNNNHTLEIFTQIQFDSDSGVRTWLGKNKDHMTITLKMLKVKQITTLNIIPLFTAFYCQSLRVLEFKRTLEPQALPIRDVVIKAE